MKIVHLCLGCFFPDNYTYQENMLPKFHKKMGYDVEVIASLATFDKDGKSTFLENGSVYRNEYDIQVTRLNYKKPLRLYRKLKRYVGVYRALVKAAPDILFIHGCQFMDIDTVVKYVKTHKHVKVYVDNHADFSNSAQNWFSKNILHKILWKYCAHRIEPYTLQFYGVLPSRVDFLTQIYKVSPEKCSLLVMGADDDKVQEAKDSATKRKIRERYGIEESDFLIMTGGKIDPWKTQTLLLMKAVAQIDDPKVKLIVFGSVTPDLKTKLKNLCVDNKIIYTGWIKSGDAYKYFASADLVVFPGRHSVLWEQVVGLGIPMVCKLWPGTTHIDLGGNVVFLKEDSVQEIENVILKILACPDQYEQMKKVAESRGMEIFSYRKISQSAIGL